MKFYLAAVLIAGTVLADMGVFETPDSGCDVNDDCSESQCCMEASTFTVVSKRFLGMWGSNERTGQCVDYIREGGDCHDLSPSSCGCTPGLACNHYNTDEEGEVRFIDEHHKRDYIWVPGYSRCESIDHGPHHHTETELVHEH